MTTLKLLLAFAFTLLALKLFGAVTWSWWIILIPFWLPISVTLGVFTIAWIAYTLAFITHDPDDEANC